MEESHSIFYCKAIRHPRCKPDLWYKKIRQNIIISPPLMWKMRRLILTSLILPLTENLTQLPRLPSVNYILNGRKKCKKCGRADFLEEFGTPRAGTSLRVRGGACKWWGRRGRGGGWAGPRTSSPSPPPAQAPHVACQSINQLFWMISRQKLAIRQIL